MQGKGRQVYCKHEGKEDKEVGKKGLEGGKIKEDKKGFNWVERSEGRREGGGWRASAEEEGHPSHAKV